MCYKIESDFKKIIPEIDETAEFTEKLYSEESIKENLKKVEKNQYILSKNGVFYRKEYKDKSAVFVSGYVPVDEKIKDTVYFTEPLDIIFKQKIEKTKEIAQIYYNDKNSYNRIYPGFDVLAQYQTKMNIPQFNFYYLADKKHNPLKKSVWVDEPYVDPAGRGWMISLIKPVYVNDALAGVAGIDITINVIIGKYLVGENEYIIILSKEGTVITVSEKIAAILSLPTLNAHRYIETIKADTYMPDNFNLLKSKKKNIRTLIEKIMKEKNIKSQYRYNYENEKYTVISEKIDEVKWIGIKFIRQN